jgi:hypothetical protein
MEVGTHSSGERGFQHEVEVLLLDEEEKKVRGGDSRLEEMNCLVKKESFKTGYR